MAKDAGDEFAVLGFAGDDGGEAGLAAGEGFRVAVVEDAVGSPGSAHAAGLDRMRRAGVIPVVAKQLHYEWMRTVARSRAFHAERPDFENPPGVLL
jgi:hypothetical protein